MRSPVAGLPRCLGSLGCSTVQSHDEAVPVVQTVALGLIVECVDNAKLLAEFLNVNVQATLATGIVQRIRSSCVRRPGDYPRRACRCRGFARCPNRNSSSLLKSGSSRSFSSVSRARGSLECISGRTNASRLGPSALANRRSNSATSCLDSITTASDRLCPNANDSTDSKGRPAQTAGCTQHLRKNRCTCGNGLVTEVV